MGRQVLARGMWLRLGRLRSKVFLSADAGWSVCLCAGIRVVPSWLMPLPFGRIAFALASACCLRASSVAPVRGGTYFSLPPQRKVGEGLNNPFFSLDF
jgi:hypothetical protein